ncbi:acetyl-CoA C-acetyltransferase [Prauserella shujinwangii]|uniref:Acetyl-CoA C-acetyltransferase n=1 Tax=Prauserella shujinwangii TaxID=1453103 RepID=A0A2T0LTV3_9PSEU|nr:acetyl-CoA C-acetyltransferase [Prauserella shujinwangii]
MLVGAGQYTWRDDDAATSPLELMRLAAETAFTDSGGSGLRERVRTVGVVDSFSWGTADPGALLAAELGLSPAETVYTHTGGTGPVELLADTADRIRRGELDAALLAGGEAVRALFGGRYSGGPKQPEGTAPTRMLGADREPHHPVEAAAKLVLPLGFYPLFENAIRATAERALPEHVGWLGRLWARFADVARDNPHAVATDPPGADAIVAAGPRNRMAAFPYRKLLTANIFVDQAAALVLCSAAAAEKAGIPRERWVFPYASAVASDHWFAVTRPRLDRSPALAAAAGAALAHAGVGIGDIGHLDLYSCFPSAVQVAATELGLSHADLTDPARPPTVTGGLTFAGGPGSNYVTHSLATLVGRLRGTRGEYGLATAVGWFLTKHGAVVLSADPPARPYAHQDRSAEVAALPRRDVAVAATGDATVETYTVVHDRSGEPERGIVYATLPGGERTAAATEHPDTIAGLLDGDPLGAKIRLTGDATFTFPG